MGELRASRQKINFLYLSRSAFGSLCRVSQFPKSRSTPVHSKISPRPSIKTGFSGNAQSRYPPSPHSLSIGPERWFAFMNSTAFTGTAVARPVLRVRPGGELGRSQFDNQAMMPQSRTAAFGDMRSRAMLYWSEAVESSRESARCSEYSKHEEQTDDDWRLSPRTDCQSAAASWPTAAQSGEGLPEERWIQEFR